jgi:hypothetical protein
MPFQSEAQRRKFRVMLQRGQITQAEYDKWESETPDDLPERKAKKKTAKTRGTRRERRTG